MQYLKDNQDPKLELKNVISILISSDFLGMARLVDECVKFIKDNLSDVVRLPIDMNCLNATLIKKISNLVTIDELINLKDRKDKLTSKIYMKKLEALMEEGESNNLYRCFYCSQLFTSDQREWMVCPKAKIFIDFHGSVIAHHVADRYWDMNRFIQFMRKENISWKDIYWKVWGRIQTFHCQVCDWNFIASEFGHCSFHPQNPKFSHGSNSGM